MGAADAVTIEEAGDTVFIHSGKGTVKISRRAGNELVIINPQRLEIYQLPPGEAKRLEDAYWRSNDEFNDKLTHLTTGRVLRSSE